MILIFYDNYFEQLKQRGTLLNYLINVGDVYKLAKGNIKQLDDYIQKYNIKIIIQFCIGFTTYYKEIGRNNIHHYVYILDNHYYNTNNNIKDIILPYKNNLIVNSYPNKNILNFNSRYFDNKIYKDYKLEKKYDILIYGAREFYYKITHNKLKIIENYKKEYKEQYQKECPDKIDFYELRTKLEKILMKYKHKYNIRILTNGNNMKPYTITGIELSKIINQSYLTVCCSSVCDFLFYKHLEIPASNSVILGDYPSDYEEIFKNNIVKIDKYMGEDEIINIIDDALSDKKGLLEKSQRLHDIIHKEHCLEKSIDDFKSIINKIETG